MHGAAPTVNRILDHPDIRAVAFVGSNAAGRHVLERGTAHGKRVQVPLPTPGTAAPAAALARHSRLSPWRAVPLTCCTPNVHPFIMTRAPITHTPSKNYLWANVQGCQPVHCIAGEHGRQEPCGGDAGCPPRGGCECIGWGCLWCSRQGLKSKPIFASCVAFARCWVLPQYKQPDEGWQSMCPGPQGSAAWQSQQQCLSAASAPGGMRSLPKRRASR